VKKTTHLCPWQNGLQSHYPVCGGGGGRISLKYFLGGGITGMVQYEGGGE
jgi:hypothetical protein